MYMTCCKPLMANHFYTKDQHQWPEVVSVVIHNTHKNSHYISKRYTDFEMFQIGNDNKMDK